MQLRQDARPELDPGVQFQPLGDQSGGQLGPPARVRWRLGLGPDVVRVATLEQSERILGERHHAM